MMLERRPHGGRNETGGNRFRSARTEYHWGELLEVPNDNDDLASEWNVSIHHATERCVNDLHVTTVEHTHLIDDEEVSCLE